MLKLTKILFLIYLIIIFVAEYVYNIHPTNMNIITIIIFTTTILIDEIKKDNGSKSI